MNRRDIIQQQTALTQQRNDSEHTTAPDETAPRIFLCYAREDHKTAKRLYDDLKGAGIAPWMDTEDGYFCTMPEIIK